MRNNCRKKCCQSNWSYFDWWWCHWTVDIGFAYRLKEAKLATTEGEDLKFDIDVGQVSTIMRVLLSKDGDLIFHSDEIIESDAGIFNTSLKHLFINNLNIAANKAKTKIQNSKEHFSGLYKTLRISTKQ